MFGPVDVFYRKACQHRSADIAHEIFQHGAFFVKYVVAGGPDHGRGFAAEAGLFGIEHGDGEPGEVFGAGVVACGFAFDVLPGSPPVSVAPSVAIAGDELFGRRNVLVPAVGVELQKDQDVGVLAVAAQVFLLEQGNERRCRLFLLERVPVRVFEIVGSVAVEVRFRVGVDLYGLDV